MAAKKKVVKRKTAKAVPLRRGAEMSVRQQARAAGETADAKAARSDAWSDEWLAIFKTTEGRPETFATTVGLSYQTIWRVGVKGETAGFKTAFLVRQWCANHNLKSPI